MFGGFAEFDARPICHIALFEIGSLFYFILRGLGHGDSKEAHARTTAFVSVRFHDLWNGMRIPKAKKNETPLNFP